jgi:hypothetical protein
MSDERWEAGIFSGGEEAPDETKFWRKNACIFFITIYNHDQETG